MSELFVEAEVRNTLAVLVKPKGVFELRAIKAQLRGSRQVGPISGYFNNVEVCVTRLSELYKAEGIYITLNPVKRALLSRRANRLDYASSDSTTKDHHIEERIRLLIDVDPERPTGVSSSKEEKAAAARKAREIRHYLRERGWPEPVIADSGNGYHLVYLLDPLPLNDELLKKVLAALASHFDGDGVKLDRSVHNSSRIVKLWGTLAAKGDNTEERPHRLSKIRVKPERLEAVTIMQLQALVNDLSPKESARPEPDSPARGTFDMEGFLARYGMEVAEKSLEPDGSTKWRLKQCPFNPDHESPDAAVFLRPDGVRGFKCFHTSCVDKHWQDFRRYFEPERSKTGKAEAKETEPPPWQDPKPLPEDLPAVPPFDYKCLPETLCPHIKDIAERMQCPADFPAVGVMIALGSVAGRKIGIRPKRRDDWVEIPNLWGLVIGRPGVLKTPALQQALVQLRRLVAKAYEKFNEAMRAYEVNTMLAAQSKKIVEDKIKKQLQAEEADKEKQIAEAKKMAADFLDKEQKEPVCRRYEINDSSIEKLGELLAENPNGLLLVRDEISGFLRDLDREDRAGDRAKYLEMWDGKGELTYDRIGRGTVRIPSNTLSMFGTIQPDLAMGYVREAVRGGAGNDGLLQRFQLAAWPDVLGDWRNVDKWPDTEAKNQAFAVFEYLDGLTAEAVGADTSEGIPFLRFTDDAQECFDAWRALLEKKLRSGVEHPAFEAHLAKYRKLVPVLALLIHLADRKRGRVSLDALSKALLWARYLEAHARRIYSAVLRPETLAARELAKHLQRGDLKERFRLREVYRKGWTSLSAKEDAEAATEILCDLGWIRLVVDAPGRAPGTPGRVASQMFEVNPKISKDPSTPTDKTDKTDSVGSVSGYQGVFQKSEANSVSSVSDHEGVSGKSGEPVSGDLENLKHPFIPTDKTDTKGRL